MHHFEHLSPVKRAELLTEGTGADRWYGSGGTTA